MKPKGTQFSRYRVYHASFGDEEVPDIVHVGTKQAALDRVTNLAHGGYREGDATIQEFRMRRPSPFVWADPGLPSDVSEQRLKQGGRWWQVNEDDVPDRPRRYVNETEDPGSFSFVAAPEHLEKTGSWKIPRSELLKRKPTYKE